LPANNERQSAEYRDGQIHLLGSVNWPDGTPLVVQPVGSAGRIMLDDVGCVIIAGFGLAGRCVADLLESHKVPYVVVEQNPVTVETQTCLGRRIINGDISDESTMAAAGIENTDILALTIPDEAAVLRATSLARRLNPDIYIIARTSYTSSSLQCAQLGADDVINAERAVALQLYDRLLQRLTSRRTPTPAT
jgi:Trk K+ transport system NAD-binding subunit